jgi:hypothetical protein
MWVLYAALVLIAGVAFGFGVVFVGIIALAALVLVAAFGVAQRSRTMHIEQVEAPQGIPGTREAAAEARVDPSRTPTGSSTGTP